MKEYTVTIKFRTDADEEKVLEISEDMKSQLETLEDDHGARVEVLEHSTCSCGLQAGTEDKGRYHPERPDFDGCN